MLLSMLSKLNSEALMIYLSCHNRLLFTLYVCFYPNSHKAPHVSGRYYNIMDNYLKGADS